MPLSLAEFVERWKAVTLTERSAAQSHFIDLCDVLRLPHADADQPDENFTFEKPVSKLHDGEGFADVERLLALTPRTCQRFKSKSVNRRKVRIPRMAKIQRQVQSRN